MKELRNSVCIVGVEESDELGTLLYAIHTHTKIRVRDPAVYWGPAADAC